MILQCLVCTWHQEVKKTFLKNLFDGQSLNSRPEYVTRTSRYGCNFGTFSECALGVFPKLKKYAIFNFLVFNTHVRELKLIILPKKCILYWCTKWERSENVTHRMSLWDIFRMLLQKPITMFHTFGEIKLKIMQFKCICTRGSKLTSCIRPKDVTFGHPFGTFWGCPLDVSPKL